VSEEKKFIAEKRNKKIEIVVHIKSEIKGNESIRKRMRKKVCGIRARLTTFRPCLRACPTTEEFCILEVAAERSCLLRRVCG
jgi:hypothetical protein